MFAQFSWSVADLGLGFHPFLIGELAWSLELSDRAAGLQKRRYLRERCLKVALELLGRWERVPAADQPVMPIPREGFLTRAPGAARQLGA